MALGSVLGRCDGSCEPACYDWCVVLALLAIASGVALWAKSRRLVEWSGNARWVAYEPLNPRVHFILTRTVAAGWIAIGTAALAADLM